MKKIFFLTSNPYKFSEASSICQPFGVTLEMLDFHIHEIQSESLEEIVRDKALKAYEYAHRPLFVEHTALFLHDFGGLPGGLTNIFWDKLTPELFCRHFAASDKQVNVVATANIAYCDGRTIRIFTGETKGRIASEPFLGSCFGWDSVFIPAGEEETFAALTPEKKNEYSMRSKAVEAMLLALQEEVR